MPEFMFSEGASRLRLIERPASGNSLKLDYIFTTQDGEWYQSDKPYSVPEWAIFRYNKATFMERGAATHIFVRVEDEAGIAIPSFVQISNPGMTSVLATVDKPSGWQNLPIFEGYNPDAGEHGPWSVTADGANVVVDGIGLPHSWHVSTFLVFVKSAEPVIQPTPPVVVPDGWPVQEIHLTSPTILRVTGGQPFNLECR